MNFFDHKDLGNHLLQLCPKVVKHPVYCLCVECGGEQEHHVVLQLFSGLGGVTILTPLLKK